VQENERISTWRSDSHLLTFGLEQERFLCQLDGGREVGEIEAIEFFEAVRTIARKEVFAANCPGQLILKSSLGDVVLSFDGYPHIVETSLPPSHSPSAIARVNEALWEMLSEAATSVGFAFSLASLNGVDDSVKLFSMLSPEKRLRFEQFLEDSTKTKQYSRPNYLAMVTASQVTLNTGSATLYDALRGLYKYLYLIPLLFSNSNFYSNGCHSPHCCRLLVLRDSYPTTYPATCIPCPIPRSQEEYRRLITFPGFIRDYSFIATRRLGLVEFRPACSQTQSDRIEELISLYALLTIVTSHSSERGNSSTGDAFWKVCTIGRPPDDYIEHLGLLQSFLPITPDQHQEPLTRLFGRAGTLFSSAQKPTSQSEQFCS